jgi:hypothetical protein
VSKYVVVKASYRYNDEYDVREGDGGIPDRIFEDRERAQNYCDHMDFEKLDGLDLSSYGFDLEYGDELDRLLEICAIIKDPRIGETDNYWKYETSLESGLSDEKLRKVRDILGLKFYEVFEVH